MPESKPMKRLIVFDLDGTLAESKSSLDSEMTELLHKLLDIVKVAVISGGDWPGQGADLKRVDPAGCVLAFGRVLCLGQG